MLEELGRAIDRQDYQYASELIGQLKEKDPENPWIHFYQGRLYEISGDLESADRVYRQLLRDAINPKILAETRRGVARLEAIEKQKQERSLLQAKAVPGAQEQGILILEPIALELKKTAAQQFAKIFKLDPYTAQLHLPTRSWRFYRTGQMGELQFYTTALKQVQIPCFCIPLNRLETINVYQVNYFQTIAPQVTVVCQDPQGQMGTLSFSWEEIEGRVEGLLPLFEESLQMDSQRKTYRKTKTLDYAQFCDLHLPGRKSILRLNDRHYKFQEGINFRVESQSNSIQQTTTRRNWNNLVKFLQQKLPNIPVRSDFTPFAESAIDYSEMLRHIKPHVNLLRRQESPWDAAFQLYSGLVFLRGLQS